MAKTKRKAKHTNPKCGADIYPAGAWVDGDGEERSSWRCKCGASGEQIRVLTFDRHEWWEED